MLSDDLLEDLQCFSIHKKYHQFFHKHFENALQNVMGRLLLSKCFCFKRTSAEILLTVSILISSNDPSAVLCTAGGGDRWSRHVSGGVQEVFWWSGGQREYRPPQQGDSPAGSHRETSGLGGSQEAFLLSSTLSSRNPATSFSFTHMSFKSVFCV